MQMLYNSDHYVVVAFDMDAEGDEHPATPQGGRTAHSERQPLVSRLQANPAPIAALCAVSPKAAITFP